MAGRPLGLVITGANFNMNKTQCERLLSRMESGPVNPMASSMVSQCSGVNPKRDTNSIDLVGHVCNHLTVIEKTDLRYGSSVLWRCKCVCGRDDFLAKAWWLKNGKIKSCGCQTNQIISEARTRHGMTDSPTWKSWKSMIDRCYCESHKSFFDYGGRGIFVCESWLNSFAKFHEAMGSRPAGTTLDRIDNNEGYSHKNCRWATAKQQASNRRTNRIILIDGVSKTITQWGELVGLCQDTISRRIKLGWDDKKSVFTPVKQQKNSRNRFGESCHVAQYSLGGV